jgi:hypothetical protein
MLKTVTCLAVALMVMPMSAYAIQPNAPYRQSEMPKGAEITPHD